MTTQGLDIKCLAVPTKSLEGLDTGAQLQLVCESAKKCLRQLIEAGVSPIDQTCLLNYIETIALDLMDRPINTGFRDTSGTSKSRREFTSRLIALILANRGQCPIDITGFKSSQHTPTPRSRAIVEIVTTWSTATELYEGLRMLRRLGGAPHSLAVIGDSVGTHLQFAPIGDPLIQPRTQEELNPEATEWEKKWDNGGYLAGAHEALDGENRVSVTGVLASSKRMLQQSLQQGTLTTFAIDTIRSHKHVLVEDLRRAGCRTTYKDVQSFLDNTFDSWVSEFKNVWEDASSSWLCPAITPIPAFLPVIEDGKPKCLRMLATTAELGLQMLFRQMRLQQGIRSSKAASTSHTAVRAASRELARFQARRRWPEFPANGNYWQSPDYCVGIEEKKDVLGCRPTSEIDLWVFDRARRTITIGEVKVARMACSTRDLSREYDAFGRGGKHRRQLAKKVRWARTCRSQFRLPWDGSASNWRVQGAVFTNAFPESVWAVHHDLPGIAPVGSSKADRFLGALAR